MIDLVRAFDLLLDQVTTKGPWIVDPSNSGGRPPSESMDARRWFPGVVRRRAAAEARLHWKRMAPCFSPDQDTSVTEGEIGGRGSSTTSGCRGLEIPG